MSLTAEEEKIMNKLNKEMKRNDSEIVSVKEWGSPRSNVQLFMPQEYCAPCDFESVTNLPDWSKAREAVYIDLNNDNYYQTGERFKVGDGHCSYYLGISDQVTSVPVGVYYFTLGDGTQNTHTLSPGDPYANHYSAPNNYKVKKIASKIIKIESNLAYYLVGENAS